MSTALLRVAVHDDVLAYSFEGPDGLLKELGPRLEQLVAFEQKTKRFWSSMESQREAPGLALGLQFVDLALPADTRGAIRRWAMRKPGDAILGVYNEGAGAIVDALPWEVLVLVLGIENLVVIRVGSDKNAASSDEGKGIPTLVPAHRRLDTDEGRMLGGSSRGADPSSPEGQRLLVIGSSRSPLPGIAREIQGIPDRFAGAPLHAMALVDPDRGRLSDTLSALKPTSIHVVLPEVEERGGEEHLVFSGDGSAMGVSAFGDMVRTYCEALHLIVLNACQSSAAAQALGRATGATAIGWKGYVSDQEAAGFALFLYARLAERKMPIEAVRDYLRRPGELSAGSIPVLHAPELPKENVEQRGSEVYRGGRASDGRLAAKDVGGGWSLTAGTRVTLKVRPQAAINPALLMNGTPALERLEIDAREPIPNAVLRVECDAGSSVSVYREMRPLLFGEQSIKTQGIHFPNLYELAAGDSGRRQINFVVSVRVNEQVLAEETHSTLWMDRNEWLDYPEVWAFIPAFVMPRTNAVQRVIAKAAYVLQGFEGEGSRVLSGYQDADVGKQVKAVYRAVQHDGFAIKYANPPAGPVHVPSSTRRRDGQRVRTPDEILDHKLGTCHDLALFFASCAEFIGIYPLVILIKGHTFFGFWRSSNAHADYWSTPGSTRDRTFGDEWLLTSVNDLKLLLERGSVEFVEATAVTNQAKSYEDARDAAAARVRGLMSTQLDVAVDVWAARRFVQSV